MLENIFPTFAADDPRAEELMAMLEAAGCLTMQLAPYFGPASAVCA